ncbi:MAG TPA: Chromate resistance protein ChrB [Roseomonas sp.]|nr:Chromate resistance protein ChrB [Roseomonas sp.]
MEVGEPARWLLLVHQLPAKPGYPRVKVWRRLQALGAVAIRNAAYALPAGEQAQEDFAWLLKEIGELGGEGMIWEARLVDGLSDEDIRSLFNAARAEDYDAVSKEARALAAALQDEGATASQGEARARLARLWAEVARVAAIDSFGANGRETAEGLLSGLETRLREDEAMAEDRREQPRTRRPRRSRGGEPGSDPA